MNYEYMVSVICETYNHENYIEDAIESFLMQKTNFNYEILIYDDASTDMTQEIIKKYEKMYPDIIKPIYQKENQFSKGIKVCDMFNLVRAKGKYNAYCEGDDYWIDPYKLQKQVDYLEKNPECSMCVHAANMVTPEDKRLISMVRPYTKNKNVSVEEVIGGGGSLFATNSIMERSEFSKNRPDFYFNITIGDYPVMINLALKGKVFYIDEVMSAYRVCTKGSWTERYFSEINNKIKHMNEIARMLREVDEYTNKKYTECIRLRILENTWMLLVEQRKFKEAKSKEYKEIYKTLSIYRKIGFILNCYIPKLYKLLFSIKQKLKLKMEMHKSVYEVIYKLSNL